MVMLLPVAAQAQQQRTFYGPDGRVTGRSVTDSAGNQRFYDGHGRSVGTSSTGSAGNMTFYDRNGHVTGRATQRR
jgi:hypothetical protein